MEACIRQPRRPRGPTTSLTRRLRLVMRRSGVRFPRRLPVMSSQRDSRTRLYQGSDRCSSPPLASRPLGPPAPQRVRAPSAPGQRMVMAVEERSQDGAGSRNQFQTLLVVTPRPPAGSGVGARQRCRSGGERADLECDGVVSASCGQNIHIAHVSSQRTHCGLYLAIHKYVNRVHAALPMREANGHVVGHGSACGGRPHGNHWD